MQGFAFRHLLGRIAFLGALWVVLSGLEPKALAVGTVAVPAAVWLSLRLLPGPRHLAVWRALRHLPAFLGASLLGGLDVARRALSPRMPLAPGWVEVPVHLPDGGRVALGAELSLMPGTLAAGTRNDRLLIHLLDVNAGFEDAIPREEAAIAAMIDGEPAPREGG
ncbi:Na+/H+ antiporter subunit E [Histidinibacterium lentulum]|uniref:Sodium:proton antiporter n=1 Tax=Histidinibacterium lentulum TaxID=2480588 RepID=A0A3N2QYG7_9RHOB|nr:Na+/H+ antiporter subunit E [Histidinibacterium lentulum]ROU00146.1 sodium:proton antiporter [Histidinibacterium lentulum]